MSDDAKFEVVVTRYPSGVFGIAYRGSMFWKTCLDEAEVHAALRDLKVAKRKVQWQERYYRNGRYDVPSDYMTRRYLPGKNAKLSHEKGGKEQL